MEEVAGGDLEAGGVGVEVGGLFEQAGEFSAFFGGLVVELLPGEAGLLVGDGGVDGAFLDVGDVELGHDLALDLLADLVLQVFVLDEVLDLALDGRVPVVLYRVVRPPRQELRDYRPAVPQAA